MQILKTLSKEQASETIALVGQWGSGKTFFLDKLLKEALGDENQRMWDENSEERRYLVFDYNCWQYDYYEEPLWAIVSALLDSVEKQLSLFGPEVNTKVKAGLKMAKKRLLGVSKTFVEEEQTLQEARGDIYYSFVKSLEKLRNGLRKLAEQEYTLVFIVDELDRCLPTYAIRVLERLHHVFSELPNTIVLLAVDEKQLDTTVKQIFGEATSTERYLEKFIDFRLELGLGVPSYAQEVAGGGFNIQDFMEKYSDYCDFFELGDKEAQNKAGHYMICLFDEIDIRRQEHLMKRLRLAHKFAINDGEKRDWFFMVFELLWLVLSEQYGIKYLPIHLEKQTEGATEAVYSFKIRRIVHEVFDSDGGPIEQEWEDLPFSQDFTSSGVQSREESTPDLFRFLRNTSTEWFLWHLQKMIGSATLVFDMPRGSKSDRERHEQYSADFLRLRDDLRVIK